MPDCYFCHVDLQEDRRRVGVAVELISRYLPVRHLRSSTQSRLCLASVDQGNNKKHFGVRAFSNAAPKVWNSLPITLREHNSKATFKEKPATYSCSQRIRFAQTVHN